jgi:hypothetical protein
MPPSGLVASEPSISTVVMICRSQKLDYALVSSLERDPLLKERLRRLRTVPGVGPITALTWALEINNELDHAFRKGIRSSARRPPNPRLFHGLQFRTQSTPW